MHKRTNSQRGGTLALAVVLILILIMVGVAFFALSLYFGGAQETKDAVNAGGLNVAKQALDISVPLSGDPSQQFFNDVSNNGQISLRNINRVWAKALFVGINAQGTRDDANNEGSCANSAQAAHDAAQAISDNLAKALNTPSSLYGFFDDYAGKNSVRMLGLGAQVQHLPGNDWKTSSLERSFESNIEFLNNLPVNYQHSNGLFTATKRNPAPTDANGRQFVVGYTPLSAMGQSYWQVAFPFEQKPHVVDRKYFDDNSAAPLNAGGSSWDSPVPNAFGVAGTSIKSATMNETAVSWIETNPQHVYPLQIPHGYIRIVLKKNTLRWDIDGAPGTNDSYGFITDSKDATPIPVGCGVVRGTSYVGNEYLPPTLYKAVCAIPPINGQVMSYLLQRVQEMVPNYSMADLIAKMNLCFVAPDDEDQTFFIYPTPDNKDVMVTQDSLTILPLGCDKSATPEGTEQTLDTEPPVPIPNFATEEFDCYGSYTFPTLCLLQGTRKWVPGTGWKGGCLGELKIERVTDTYLITFPCPCPP